MLPKISAQNVRAEYLWGSYRIMHYGIDFSGKVLYQFIISTKLTEWFIMSIVEVADIRIPWNISKYVERSVKFDSQL